MYQTISACLRPCKCTCWGIRVHDHQNVFAKREFSWGLPCQGDKRKGNTVPVVDISYGMYPRVTLSENNSFTQRHPPLLHLNKSTTKCVYGLNHKSQKWRDCGLWVMLRSLPDIKRSGHPSLRRYMTFTAIDVFAPLPLLCLSEQWLPLLTHINTTASEREMVIFSDN